MSCTYELHCEYRTPGGCGKIGACPWKNESGSKQLSRVERKEEGERMSLPEMLGEKVVVYMCSECIEPCILLRPPVRGERSFECWKGEVMLVGEPDKKIAKVEL